MDVQTPLPDDVDELKKIIARQQQSLQEKDHSLESKEQVIERLQALLQRFQQQRFGPSSEKHPGQAELQLFNEAEVIVESDTSSEDHENPTTSVAAHQRKQRGGPRPLPEHLPRIELRHELNADQRLCDACGNTMQCIGQESSEQLGVIPQQFYVIRTLRDKYACSCKGCMKTAPAPKQPIPGSQASATLLAHIMVSKFHDGLPFYRQEKIAARGELDLPRCKQARWLIGTKSVLQPLYNLAQDVLFSYDIVYSDDTTIQVLKEDGRAPSSKSALWIRRGGPPDKPVVLVDYRPSKSGATAYSLLSECKGYLVCDAAPNFNQSINTNALIAVHCNDHARRRFADILKGLNKKEKTKGWAATKAIAFYKQLYQIEADIAPLSADEKYQRRQTDAVPLWKEYIGWARQVIEGGIRHAPSREALTYLLNHQQGLQQYCSDGRLPISNIKSEHVAKTIALARKNFLFADTPAGASASAMIYSLLETAKANHHQVHQYMSVVLSELPSAESIDVIEKLLPWNLTPEEVRRRFNDLPKP